MNKKVFTTMLTLTITFLCGLYIFKIFFPQEFVMSVENPRIVAIGAYIDGHKWLYYICCGITAFITYWLFMCACKRSWYLNIKESLIVIAFIVAIRVISLWDNNIATYLSIVSFFMICLICKFNLKTATIVYSVHGLAQVLSLSIRNLPMYLTQINFATGFLLTFEMYLWLILFYIIYNYKKEEG